MLAVMLRCEAEIGELLRQIVDIESVSGHEQALADQVFQALAVHPHLRLARFGNVVVARTDFGRPERVVVAGHLDTVPVMGNLPSRLTEVDGATFLVGRGTVDMKAGVAVQLNLAATLTDASRDLTWIFYDNEEVEAVKNGLGHLALARPDLMRADLAILMEPSGAQVEAGCQGTLRVVVRTHGVAAHSARAWLGHNAIHDMAGALAVLAAHSAQEVLVDGLPYREGLNAVGISGGVAGNVVPDACELSVNYRFAPDKTVAQAEQLVRQVFAGYDLVVEDAAPAAAPGLGSPIVASFVQAVGRPVRPKYGWTDVARFAELGIPALNFGPGEPDLAHTVGERVRLDQVRDCRDLLARWLTAPAG